jgi:CheY-like chemotaxis protein
MNELLLETAIEKQTPTLAETAVAPNPRAGGSQPGRSPSNRAGSRFSMSTELKILMVEDVAQDAELVEAQLHESGIACRLTRLDANDQLFAHLRESVPDVVLSDHGLPSLDGFTVLTMVRDRYPYLPFIFVTGSPDRAMAEKAYERGASACVHKERLYDLAPVIKRALREEDARRRFRIIEGERDQLTVELNAARAELNQMRRMLPLCSSCKKVRDEQSEWHPLETHLCERLGVAFSHGLCPDCVQKYFTGFH